MPDDHTPDRRTGFEYSSGDTIIVVGGGPALPGCPESWEDARAWADEANKTSPVSWSWDCHFKLDCDGPLLSVDSRFYPPAKFYGPGWTGGCRIRVGDWAMHEKKFNCPTLEELKAQVDAHIHKVIARIKEQLATLDFD